MGTIERVEENNRDKVNEFIIQQWHTTKMAVRGKIVGLDDAEGFVFVEKEEIIGLVTYTVYKDTLEILSLNSVRQNVGIGTMLLNKAVGEARHRNCKRIVLVTTNDNINALQFYQKRGFDMVRLFYNSIADSRKLKPEIPLAGDNFIPLKSEIEMEMCVAEGKIKLVEPDEAMENGVMHFRDSFMRVGEKKINGSRGLHHFEVYSEWLEGVRICKVPNNHLLRVASSLYMAVREQDGKVVGCIELRHSLNKELAKLGGHIGYSVAPDERCKGYAVEMLEFAVAQARKLGVGDMLLTCNEENIGSEKVIEKCGGVFEGVREAVYHGRKFLIKRYWIPKQ